MLLPDPPGGDVELRRRLGFTGGLQAAAAPCWIHAAAFCQPHRLSFYRSMTRFKELRRIERAIEHRDQRELEWAEQYCEGRIAIAHRSAFWRRILKRVLAAKTQT